jgi:hypothetical protein
MKATASKEGIKKFIIKKDDVLFTKDSESFDDNANPCLINEDFTNVVCGYHLAQIRANKKDLIGKYLFRLFQSINYNYYFSVNSKGITRVGKKKIKKFIAVEYVQNIGLVNKKPDDDKEPKNRGGKGEEHQINLLIF